MSDFMYLFLDNFVANSTMPLGSVGSSGATFSSAVTSSGTATSSLGTQLMDESNEALQTTGCISTSVGTSVSLNGVNAYQQTIKQLEMTQAYVESLNEEQMLELLSRLETKESELLEIEKGTQKTKHL